MKEKLDYDKKRHKEIRINGKKAKMLGYTFFTHHHDRAECVLLKTKIPGNYPTDLVQDQHRVYTIEIPAEDGVLVIQGKIRTMGSAPNMSEYGFEILLRHTTAPT